MNNLKAPIIVAAVCLLVAASSSYAWEGFKIPNLNPFAKKTTSTKYHLSDSKSKSWVPSLPKVNLLPKRKPGQPSTIQKVSNSTQTFVNKTTSALNPFKKKPEMPPVSPKLTGSKRTYSGSASLSSGTEKPKEKNWLIKLLTYEKTETEDVRTTNDFLRLKRPGFDDE